MWEQLRTFIAESTNFNALTINIVSTIILIVSILLIKRLLFRIIQDNVEDTKTAYNRKKTTEYILFGVAIIALVQIWLNGFSSLTTYLGLLSAGLAIALQTPITNLFGWLFLVTRKPFAVGDRIQIGDYAGDVIDIEYSYFTMMEIGEWVDGDQSTGRLLMIPNFMIFNSPISSYSAGLPYIWHEIPVEITLESNWEEAKRVLEKIVSAYSKKIDEEQVKTLQAQAKKSNIYITYFQPVVYTDVSQSRVVLTMRFLTEPRRRRSITQKIWEATLKEFATRDDIDFAYPTERQV